MKAVHHIPHCAVDERVLECRIECSVLAMGTANVFDKDILLPYTYSILSLIIYDVNLSGHILYVSYLEDDCAK